MQLPPLRTNCVFVFLLLVIVISVFVINENLMQLQELEKIAQIENPEERAELIAKQIIEAKLIEKLIVVYGQEKTCPPQELIGHLNFVNTFSIFTGVYVNAPQNEAQAEQVIHESDNCIPEITKTTVPISQAVYSVSYQAIFPPACSLPNKRIEVVIESDVQALTAEITKGKLHKNVRQGLGNHISTLDKFGNCSREVIYKIAVDLGIADLPETI